MKFLKCHTTASSKRMRNLCFFKLLHFLRQLKKNTFETKNRQWHSPEKKTRTSDSQVLFSKQVYRTFMSHQQVGRQNYRRLKTSSESVATFIHWGTTVRNQNCMHAEIKGRLNPGNGCYPLIQKLSSFHFLPNTKNIKT